MTTPFNFTYDPNQAQSGFGLIDKGEYECFISNVEIKTFKTDNVGLTLTLTIRDDIPGQKFGKRKLFQNLVPTEKGMQMFHTMFKATRQPVGFQATSLEQVAEALQSKPIRITINHKTEVYQGETRTRENIVAFTESKEGGIYVAPDTNPFNGSTPVTISDDDLPF